MGVAGSAEVKPVQWVKAFDAIVERAGKDVAVSFYGCHDQRYAGETVPPSALKPAHGDGQGLTREYFEELDFSGKPTATRVDEKLDVDFGKEATDAKSVEKKQFWVRWTGTLTAPVTGAYLLNVDTTLDQAGVRLYVKDQLVQDKWPGIRLGR